MNHTAHPENQASKPSPKPSPTGRGLFGLLSRRPQGFVNHGAQTVRLPRIAFCFFAVDIEGRRLVYAERVRAFAVLEDSLGHSFAIHIAHEAIGVETDLLCV